MNIEQFVADALTQIRTGLRKANQAAKENDSKQINNIFLLAPGASEDKTSGIEFDIAVTAKAEGKAEGRASVGISVVGVQLGSGGAISKEQVSRIKFMVHIRDWTG